MSVRKMSAIFGLSRLLVRPCRKAVVRRTAGAGAGVDAAAGTGPPGDLRECHHTVAPRYTG
jgi:hypothetical protein